MKKMFFIFIIVITSETKQSYAQGTWTQKADFGGEAREGAAGFSIGTKGYVGTGLATNVVKVSDFWEYDSQTNIWTQLADFPDSARCEAIGFSIGTKGYLGFGGDGSVIFNDFWEYDPISNTWTKKNSLLISARYLPASFSIGNKGYVSTGMTTAISLNDLWEYDPNNDSWTQKANVPGSTRKCATGFTIANKGYIGLGMAGNYDQDFWEYDPILNSWTQIANYPGVGRGYPVAFSVGTNAFVGMGWNVNSFPHTLNDFWRYDATSNSWFSVSTYGGGHKCEGVAFTINQKGYVGTGALDSGLYYSMHKDFWEFDPNGNSIAENEFESSISVYPNPFSTSTTIHVLSLKSNVLSIMLYDVNGAKIKSFNSGLKTNDFVLERGILPIGVYFIHISSENKTAVKKIIISD